MRADGVFSGGGVKGLAFAGALQASAEAGYDDWERLAGTSAGAIAAMALAVGYDARGLREQLDRLGVAAIADYGPLGPLQIPFNVETRKGVTRGKALTAWIERLLAAAPAPARTFGDLDEGRLQVVGTDVAHRRMVVFPQDVARYVDERGNALDPATFPIATAVRISAGFPYFFPPLTLRDGHTGKPGVLVDGGVTSAVPVFLFDRPEDPRHPTWAFRLYDGDAPEQPAYTAIDGPLWFIGMLEAIVDTATHALDAFELPRFADRTVAIPTDGVPTLDFSLTEEQKVRLYRSGYETTKAFFAGGPTGENAYGLVPANRGTP